METVDCYRCGGCGELDASAFPCPACNGRGYTKGISMNYSIDWDGPGERESEPKRKHQTLEDVIADMESCAEQYHNGLRLDPQTIGHVFDTFTYELSFYADQGSILQQCIHKARLRTQDALRAHQDHIATPPQDRKSDYSTRASYLHGVLVGMQNILTDLEMKQPFQAEEHKS